MGGGRLAPASVPAFLQRHDHYDLSDRDGSDHPGKLGRMVQGADAGLPLRLYGRAVSDLQARAARSPAPLQKGLDRGQPVCYRDQRQRPGRSAAEGPRGFLFQCAGALSRRPLRPGIPLQQRRMVLHPDRQPLRLYDVPVPDHLRACAAQAGSKATAGAPAGERLHRGCHALQARCRRYHQDHTQALHRPVQRHLDQ